jgi:hypothetical protein
MSGMLTERPGDRSRLRADTKRQVKLFVNKQALTAEFTARDVSIGSDVSLSSVYTLLQGLERKGVLTSRIKAGDARRFYQRVAGKDVR